MNWRPFDIKSFLKASRHWEEDKARLRQEMDDLSFLPSVDNKSGVRSGTPSDMTSQIALRRLRIASLIEEIELNEEMLKCALKQLTEDERRLIDGFYYPKKKIGVFVQEYGREMGICENYVYNKRNKALDKMRMIIEKEYYGEE